MIGTKKIWNVQKIKQDIKKIMEEEDKYKK